MTISANSQTDNSVYKLENWEFSKADTNIWLPLKVPGNVHTALFLNQQIPDPFLSDNEKDLQWIGLNDWKFRTSFEMTSKELLDLEQVLIFECLDTYAEVKLNDKKILTANNMFRSWEVDVTDMLKKGTNIIEITFTSPVNFIKTLKRPLGISFPGGERVLTRKAQYQFGWDWAPTYITMGIIRPVYLKRWKNAGIDKMDIDYRINGQTASVNLEANIKVKSKGNYTIKFSIGDYEVETDVSLNPGLEVITLSLLMDDINLWWPNGMGNQNLYNAKVEILQDDQLLEAKTQNIGFRTIELIKEKDTIGESFYFKVNGKAFFAKGANYVPPSSFPDQVDSLKLDVLIKEAKEANFNMLRVWGGGYYETDQFYELCDKYGILIWQDFMFACAMYPDEKYLLESIIDEATENVKRISWHPCMALWCGNNEISEGWERWGWKDGFSNSQQTYLAHAYQNIFTSVLPAIVAANGHNLPYHESSPTYGRGDIRYKTTGDAHDWWVWHDSKPFEHFLSNVPRFMSEFGYQSYPDIASIKIFAGDNPELSDTILGAHQKHLRGNELIKSYMEKEYPKAKDFESFVYLSQRLQAEGIGMGIEAQRLAMPDCMGSLYWQYNDCWPSVSWSSVDYYGRWKALQHKVKTLFAPLLLVEKVKTDSVEFHVVSDLPGTQDLRLYTDIYDLNGDFLYGGLVHCNIKPNTSVLYHSIDLKPFISRIGKKNLCVASRLVSNIGEVFAEDLKFLMPVKDLNLSKSQITYELKKSKEGIIITLSTSGVTPGVWLSSDLPGKFSTNYFDMLPGRKIVSFNTKESIDDFKKSFKIRSLRDNWE